MSKVNAEVIALVGMGTGYFIVLFYTPSLLENLVDGNIPAFVDTEEISRFDEEIGVVANTHSMAAKPQRALRNRKQPQNKNSRTHLNTRGQC